VRAKILAALLVLGAAACGDTGTNVDNQGEGQTGLQPRSGQPGGGSGVEPSRAATANSNPCPQRCGYSLAGKTGLTGNIIQALGVSEDAMILFALDLRPGQWSLRTGKKEFAAPAGFAHPQSRGQNGWGQVVGLASTSTSNVAVAWEPNGTAIVLSDRPYGPPLQGEARAISDNSVIVGVSGDRAYRTHYKEGFRWLAAAGSAASDVNQKGQVAGYATVSGARRAMVWAQDGTATDLGVLPGQTSSEAVAISETGIVVGTSGASQGFIWSATEGMKALPANFIPRDVNHWGEVAGAFENTGQCAVHYKGYGTFPLPMTPDFAVSCVATGINSWGDVVGYEHQPGIHRLHRIPTVWTWSGNQYRYGF
jgi:probable HAF family extracellular repeat protein